MLKKKFQSDAPMVMGFKVRETENYDLKVMGIYFYFTCYHKEKSETWTDESNFMVSEEYIANLLVNNLNRS